MVFKRIAEILHSPDFGKAVPLTVSRLIAGLAAGTVPALLIGIPCGLSLKTDDFFKPLLGTLQSVPPVAWLAMALIWFGFNGTASVFIVALATFPVVMIAAAEGVKSMDPRLNEVCVAYGFSWFRKLELYILPSLAPFLRGAGRTALGNGWKTVVMGEVLTTSTGIGGEITDARLNIESESVLAWAFIAAALFFLMQALWEILDRLIWRRHAARA